jgi:SAM-dependent methyltransferase
MGRFLFFLRDLISRKLFLILEQYCRGNVLDVGGASFFQTALKKKFNFETWTILEVSNDSVVETHNKNIKFEIGDGCNMRYPDASFDTILNIQVLEHTFEPFKMFQEVMRVLKPGGKAVFLIPQTGTMHLAPYHYQNFLRFWIEEAAKRTNSEILLLEPLGGWWSTIASRGLYFFMTAFGRKGNSWTPYRRNVFFYLLFPMMVLYVLFSISFCLFLALGDLKEEPNNHLAIITKK